MVETGNPLRAGRLAILYPVGILGGGTGTYISILRVLAGTSNNDDLRNLAINLAIVGICVFFGKRELDSRDEDLEKASITLATTETTTSAGAISTLRRRQVQQQQQQQQQSVSNTCSIGWAALRGSWIRLPRLVITYGNHARLAKVATK